MANMTIYGRVKQITEQAFGEALCPHDFRHVAATTMATHDPEHIRIAAPLLGHRNFGTTEKYYIQADALQASRRLRRSIRNLRKELR